MIRDLQMMRDISPLFDKKLVIWGMGQKGRKILADIIEMGAGKKGILLCDSDCSLQGEKILNNIVLSPRNMQDKIKGDNWEKLAFLVTVVSINAQDEIIEDIKKICDESVDIYTEYAVEWGIYFGLEDSYINKEYKEKKYMSMKRTDCLIRTLWNIQRGYINIFLSCHYIMMKLSLYINRQKWHHQQFTKVFQITIEMFYIAICWTILEKTMIVC